MTTLNSNEHRIIIAALETYQSMWAVAVTEAQREKEPIDERFTRERYVEAGELLAKFKAEPEGGDALAMVGKLDANIAAEQARDREGRIHGLARVIYEQTRTNSRPWEALDLAGRAPFLHAAERARASVRLDLEMAAQRRGTLPSMATATAAMAEELPSDRAILDHLDHNLDDLRSADEEMED